MKAWAVNRPGPVATAPLQLADKPVPVPGLGQVRLQIRCYAELFQERSLRSVTAKARADGEEFLGLAARHGIRATTVPYPWTRADEALADLAAGRYSGAAVLQMPS